MNSKKYLARSVVAFIVPTSSIFISAVGFTITGCGFTFAINTGFWATEEIKKNYVKKIIHGVTVGQNN